MIMFLFGFALCLSAFGFGQGQPTDGKISWPDTLIVGVSVADNQTQTEVIMQAALREAEMKLKSSGYMPPNLKIQYIFVSPCDSALSLNAIGLLRDKSDVDVYIGPNCEEGITSAGLLASYYNIAISSTSTVDNILQDRTKYATLFTVGFTSTPLGDAIVSVLLHYNWTHVTIVRNYAPECDIGLSGLYMYLYSYKKNITVEPELYLETPEDAPRALGMVKNIARIIILCFGWNPSHAQEFLRAASRLGMVNAEYVYIAPFYGQPSATSWKPWESADVNVQLKSELFKAYQSTIVLEPVSQLPGKQFLQHLHDTTNSNLTSEDILTVALNHDSFYLYGLAANKTLQSGKSLKNGREIRNAVKNQQFIGVTGVITMDEDGDRIPQYYVSAKTSNGSDITPFMTAMFRQDINGFKFESTGRDVVWGTVGNKPPPAVPVCGFSNERCPKNYNVVISLVSVSVLCLIPLITVAIRYRKKRLEKQLAVRIWKINMDEFKLIDDRNILLSMSSFVSQLSSMKLNKKDENIKKDKTESEFYDIIAYYKGRPVAAKCWNKSVSFKYDRDLLLLLKTMMYITHHNLNVFLGAHLDTPLPKIVIWAHSERGSLADILFQEEIHLDATFRSSFLNNIVDGLNFLHKSDIGCHGYLNSSNCLISSHWVIKLSEFGISRIWTRKYSFATDTSLNVFHIAPEYFRTNKDEAKNLSLKKADVYSFSIVMYQILFRSVPYSNLTTSSSEEIVESVVTRDMRPLIPTNLFNAKLVELMKLCWQNNSANRPQIGEIKNSVISATKANSKNSMENVLKMLEKYASSLEKLVEERTQLLNEERLKTDNLLYQLLPRSVAETLKRGDAVVPETYDAVTVYFSDIVNFTTLCSGSTPLQVVTFVNRLYADMDNVIGNFDVYKMETVGDTYMIVSGLPERNGNKHVMEIANMAFKILQLMSKYVIVHKPQKIIQIRIGINTGPVAAGIVGVKTPKYCIFGDAINVAAKMENTGLPGKIQITEFTKFLLQETGLYKISRRGELEAKGKGSADTTFWLSPS